MDEENNTFIVDRKKELIKTKGFQVRQVEECLLTVACVFGVLRESGGSLHVVFSTGLNFEVILTVGEFCIT